MFRTARLLRAPTLSARPVASPLWHARMQVRLYADKKAPTRDQEGTQVPGSATAARPKENPHAENQNATTTAMGEIRQVTRDIADMISGGASGQAPHLTGGTAGAASHAASAIGAMEQSSHSHGGSVKDDFASITTTLFRSVPKPALYFGLAGTIPYLGTAGSIIFMAREASRAGAGLSTLTGLDVKSALDTLHVLEHVQITYGAIILSFLGAIHWGFEFAKLGGAQGNYRLMLGTLPVLFAWPTTFLSHGVALAAQWVGFTGMWFIDQRASTNGWTTSWYSTYRFYLSIIVGFSIIGTLAGTGYYGAGAGAGTSSGSLKEPHHRLNANAAKGAKAKPTETKKGGSGTGTGKMKGKVAGDIQVDEEESGEAYGHFRNIAKEEEQAAHEKEEEEKKKAEQKQKNKEFQDKRDEHQMDKAPGTMKSDAKDRTGRNANVPGGTEEKPSGGSEGAGGVGKHGKVENESAGTAKAEGNKSETGGETGGKPDDRAQESGKGEGKGQAGDKLTAMK